MKECVCLGEFVPFGQQFLADKPGGKHYQVARERDGIVAEEEIYIASDGRVIWSSGRQIVRGFQSPAPVVHALRCGFAGLPAEAAEAGGGGGGGGGSAAAARGVPGAACGLQCLGVLEPDRFAVHAPNGSEFLVHLPPRAVWAWPLQDGVIILVRSADGSDHAVSLIEHPLNLPRCVSYIDPDGAVWKDECFAQEACQDAPKTTAHLRWVCDALPLAVAYVPSSRTHAVYLLRRATRAPAAVTPPPPAAARQPGAPGGGAPPEGLAICREASEVFLQRLWAFPGEAPQCELDDVFLLAPDPEFARAASSAGSADSSTGLLLALLIRATQQLCIVRLWTWEVVATMNSCRAAVPLLPGDDLEARTACPSGFAGFPSRWHGAGHCRVVLQESNAPSLPTAEGLPQPWADLLLEPLELLRSSAVLCFDRHRLPQYLLVLGEERRDLALYWGSVQLCGINIADSCLGFELPAGSIAGLEDAVANRFTVRLQDGRAFRCFTPLQPHSPCLLAVLTSLTFLLPGELAYALASDAQAWCIQHSSAGGSYSDEEDHEWHHFCELMFCLVEQALAGSGDLCSAPPFKRARKACPGDDLACDDRLQDDSESLDWEWLLGSAVHAHERLDPSYAALESSMDFTPHPALRQIAMDAERCPMHAAAVAAPAAESPRGRQQDRRPQAVDVWEGRKTSPPALLLRYIDRFFLSLHLLYEEWKLHALHSRFLPLLGLFLYGLASRLRCAQFSEFYAQDLPTVRDAALAMAAYGGYGAWLWQVFPREQRACPTNAQTVQRLQEMQVPHLLLACRLIGSQRAGRADAIAQPYPAVFPLSSLLLSILRALQGLQCVVGTAEAAAALGMPALSHPELVVRIPSPASCAPMPLPPFVSPRNIARNDADRARSVRRWLQGPPDLASRPSWEVVLMLLIQHRVQRADVELWNLVLAAPVQECLRAAAEQPGSEWLVEAYSLIGREDLALLAKGCEAGDGEVAGATGARRASDILEAAGGLPATADDVLASSPSADPLESSEWLYRMFDHDRRAKEVARLLNSSRPLTLRVFRRPEQTDHDFEQHKQSRLGLAARRQAALCNGRGAFTLGAVRPLPTELLHTPPLTLAGRFPPQPAVLALDPNHHNPELNLWAEFSNGVATALQVSDAPGSEVTRGWILHHKSEAAAASGQGSVHSHAGFLCGLGLRGSLKVMPLADCYKYLRLQHDTTSVAVVLGMAASHVGSMEPGLTRMCCVHIPSMLPATYSDMEVASPVQCAAVLSLGLLFARSAHRMMTELLVAEIGRRPSDRALHDREGYSLASGFALGCVCLGLGADAPGLADLQLHTWLLRYIHGGPEMPMPGVATRDQKHNPNHDPATCSSLIAEPDGINVSITSPAGCIALALVFLQTNNDAVASRIVIPNNVFQLDYIRPDFAMLRLVARCLIMWDSINAADAWLDQQVPPFLRQLVIDAKRLQVGAARASQQPVPSEPHIARSAVQPRTPTGSGTVMRSPQAPPPVRAASSPLFTTPSPLGPAVAFGRTGGLMDAAPGSAAPQDDDDLPTESTMAGLASEVDWLLVHQTEANIIAGACLAIGLRFAGTGDPAAKSVLLGRLRIFRDAPRSDAHPALMASQPTPGMDLDRTTLETCQSVVAMALGMVMAGTGDLCALRMLRSLRKRADLETSYGVHMATHIAIGWVFLGGGRYTFDQDPLSIAALFMAAFPRFPGSFTDNRCHLQAFRHLYVLAARHRCVEAVEVETQQPVEVDVTLSTARGAETVTLPRLIATSGDVRAVTLDSERYWPVTICRAASGGGSGPSPAAGSRWMCTLEASRRLYVKRRSGHLPHKVDRLGAQCAAQAWFPTFTTPQRHHLERLLQIPKAETGGAAAPQPVRVGNVAMTWLQSTGIDASSGTLDLGALAVSSAEWAAVLCADPAPALPPGAYEFDFAEEGDGSLSERLDRLLLESTGGGEDGLGHLSRISRPRHVLYANWLHECIIESKLVAYPFHLLVYLQSSHIEEVGFAPPPRLCSPASTMASAMAIDQIVTLEWFYAFVHQKIGACHRPLLAKDFLTSRCSAVREVFLDGGHLAAKVMPALRAHFGKEIRRQFGAARLSELQEAAVVAIFCRLHGLLGRVLGLETLSAAMPARVFSLLPKLRRVFPGATVHGLRQLAASLESGAA